MNGSDRFLRNRVRSTYLPELREENPRFDEALVRLADAAREQRQVLDFAADQLISRARLDGHSHSFEIEVLLSAPPGVVKRAIASVAQSAGGSPLESRHLESVLVLIEAGCDGTVSLDLPGLRVVREYDVLRIYAQGSSPELGDLASALVNGPDGPYQVRRWQPGDRMRPARLKGRSRKLSDLFIDSKVPRDLRARARVVTRIGDGEIVWAEHVGPAHGSAIQVTLTDARTDTSTKN
jgi:tRNA(Ile)-lysidine synthase